MKKWQDGNLLAESLDALCASWGVHWQEIFKKFLK